MEDFLEKFNKCSRARKIAEDKNKEDYKKISQGRLAKNIETKIRTTFIGNINTFEKYFGELFGCGKKTEDLTKDQKYFRSQWEQCRKEILDKGNNELRAAKSEINEYTVEWNRYHKTLPVIGGYSGKE